MIKRSAIAALFGCGCLLFLTTLPPVWIAAVFAAALGLLFWRNASWRAVLWPLLIMALAFSYANYIAQTRLSWQLAPQIENKPIRISGRIISLPVVGALSTSFVLRFDSLNQKTTQAINIKLSWYGRPPRLALGERWQLQVKLKRIRGFANPGSFDYARYMLQQNIRAVGYVRNSASNRLLSRPHPWLHLDSWRQHLKQQIQQALPHSPFAAMVVALVVGDKSGITAAQWHVLQRTGTNHLMVIAGLHIGMLSGLAFWLVNWLWRRSRRLMLRMAAQRVAALAALFTAFSYSALAGFSIPTERATVMVAVFMSALFFLRRLALGTGLALAMLCVLLIHPLAPLSIGFWLSFAAVGVIFYGMSARIGAGSRFGQVLRLQWVVSLGLLPFTLLLFQNASLISPLANSIVIPLVGFIVVPLSLLASVLGLINMTLAGELFHVAVWVLKLVWWILSTLATPSFFAWQQAVPTAWCFVAAFIAILLLLAPRAWPAKWLAVCFCLPILFYKPPAPKWGEAEFTLLDVGQGLASVVQTAHHILVFDTGAKFGPNFNMGAAVVVPFLRTLGVRKVDAMVISHGDNDHIGGASAVLQAMQVTQIITSVPKRFLPRQARLCLVGEHWVWDGVRFAFLYPDKAHLGLDNNSSCVLRISAGDKHLLLTGDIEKPAETWLDANAAETLQANIIVAPHHGSKTSSSLAFLQHVKPDWVFYPMGYLNKYRFPSASVVQRYQTLGVKSLRSDQEGAIKVLLGTNTPIKPIAYRKSRAKFWRQN
jgi:competence protein ComEC